MTDLSHHLPLRPPSTDDHGHGHGHRRSSALAVVLFVAALLVGTATTAEAHDVLVGTSPEDGSTTAIVPARVSLTFNQPVLGVGTVVIVTGPDGPVQSGPAVLVGRTVTERLKPGSPAGRYTVTWRASSADGHPVSGTFSFTARAPSKAQPTAATTSPAPTSTTTTTSATSAPGTASTPAGTATPADTGGQASTVGWVVGAGVLLLALLLTAAFLVTRKPRTTPHDERDPKS